MMKSILIVNYFHGLSCILALAIPTFGSTVIKLPFDDWGYPRPCYKHCPYGYETDIEGNSICKCHNPCLNIYCFGGTTCVISKPKNCLTKFCKLEATCKDLRPKKDKLSFQKLNKKYKNEAYDMMNSLQKDAVINIDEAEAVCDTEIPSEAFECKSRTRRYAYDSGKDMCIKFRGCESSGNNFARKRDCKRKCLKKFRKDKSKRKSMLSRGKGISNANFIKTKSSSVCSLPVEPVSWVCTGKLVKRWYYNAEKGVCLKMKGCERSGNNFKRKRDCKLQCMRKNGKTSGNRRKTRKGRPKSKVRRYRVSNRRIRR